MIRCIQGVNCHANHSPVRQDVAFSAIQICGYFFVIPTFATWHLSFCLFGKGYFEFFAGLDIPGMKLAVRFFDAFINLFRWSRSGSRKIETRV